MKAVRAVSSLRSRAWIPSIAIVILVTLAACQRSQPPSDGPPQGSVTPAAPQVTALPAVDYLFNEEGTPLPDLGGLQIGLPKRMRHRRALVRMLFDYWQTDRLVLCLDPASTDLIQDFYNDRARVRLLEIDCEFTDDYLVGHARRVGLAGPHTAPAAMAQLLPTIRYDVRFESDRLRDMNLAGHVRIRQSASADENALPLAEFLGIPVEAAREIAATDYLFVD